MPMTDYHSSTAPFASLGRSILSIRREQVHSMDAHQDEAGGSGSAELDSFQKHVADLFLELSCEDLLSISWIQKLLEAFLVCQEEFRAILLNQSAIVSRPPLDRLAAEFFERSVKALDVCNAIRDGIEQVRQFHKYLEIVQLALYPSQRTYGEGQLRRAKKALTDLTIAMIDEKEGSSVVPHRNRSFGRMHTSKESVRASSSHSRSLSWSVSRSWSAARQLQAIANNLQPPRSNEITASNGIAVAVYTMNCVLLFVMSSLVAAIPCQDRGLQTHFSPPRNFSWAGTMIALHERILEESKRKERKNSCGLMKEIHDMEICTRNVADLADPALMTGEREAELRLKIQDLSLICDSLKTGLDPLERQVRDVFHRIVRSRTDGLDCLGQSAT